jgi:hypothetical protein
MSQATALAQPAQPALSEELIERRIFFIRGQKVMLDSDLAELYGVPTSRLNEAVKRNRTRFPPDFMFQLSEQELDSLISQIAISNAGRGGRRTLPYAFTEHGVAMLSSVLRSERAIQMNILIVRAFIRIREMLISQADLTMRVERLEANQDQHASVIQILADEIDAMKRLPEPNRRRIGFEAASQ